MTESSSPNNPGPHTSGREVSGERRTVTALFCDVTGSTAMAEQLDAEEWAGIMNEAFAYMTGPVDRYEGTVARLLGDAILAFFGAPNAHEDDPRRAVLAALDIVAGIAPLKAQIKAEFGFDFDLRVGINTGAVVVGEVGSKVAAEYTIMGDAVNVAARMEQTAEPGTVQIAEATYRLVGPLFECEALGGIEVKGKTRPVQAYRVLAPREVPGSLRGIEGLDSAVVGRDVELATMRDAVDEVRRGRGQIVALIGEAGLGKSRLIAEARGHWGGTSADDPTWLEGRGVAYDMTRPYGLFLEITRRMLGVSDDDTPDMARAKVEAVLTDLEPEERARVVQSVEMLLSLKTDSVHAVELQGEAIKRDLFTAVLEATRYLAVAAPRVMVFDDLHWSDPASAELLQELFALTEEVPLLLVCAFRPERQSPAWRVKQQAETNYPHRYIELALRPLSNNDTEKLVNNLLTRSDLPGELRELILQKTEGNPFFIEEVVRTLIDRGAVVRDESDMRWHSETNVASIPIPDNLQALLISRIDQLEEQARHTLQLASVIGRTFPHRVLQRLAEAEDPLDRQLSTLQRFELIREVARLPEIEYSFRHELTRQAAYDSILLRRRPGFHQRVGEAIEEIYADRLDEQAHRLAYHFSEAKDDERSLRYSTIAGDAAARFFANDEAVEHYARALEIAVRARAPNEQVVALYTKRGRSLELSGRYDEALDSYRELEALATDRGDRTLELAALVPQATIFSTLSAKSDPDLGKQVADRALSIATEVGDARGQTKSLWNLMLASYYSGANADTTIAYGDRAIEVAQSNGLKEELAYALNDIARPLFESGRTERAQVVLTEAAGLWRALGNLPMLTDNLDSTANCVGCIGKFELARTLAEESISISRTIGNVWGEAAALFTSGFFDLELGNYGKAIETVSLGGELAAKVGFSVGVAYACMMRAWAYGTLGAQDRALEEAKAASGHLTDIAWARAFGNLADLEVELYSDEPVLSDQEVRGIYEKLAEDRPPRFFESLFLVAGELARASGHYDALLQLASVRVAEKRRRNAKIGFADMLYLQGVAHEGLGHADEARAAYDEARQEAEAVGLRRTLWPILARLAPLEAEAGNEAKANGHMAAAREIVEHIAKHTGSEELTASFMSLPTVQSVLRA